MEVEGYPTVGEQRTGWIYGRSGQPIEIVYEIHDGLAIWEGDIVVGRPDQVAGSAAELALAAVDRIQGVVVNDNGSNRWPGGVIPYTIDDASQNIVDAAIDRIEDQTPGVTLIQRTSEANYVTFRDASGCSSEIGMIGGQQFINLLVSTGPGSSFCSTGNAAHEILHALGIYHEHTRCDRDDFVTIDYAEIESGKEGNFYKAGSGSQTGACSGATDIGAYDYGSMMHYDAFAFAKTTTKPTITATQPLNGAVMGQRAAVGPTDAETIDDLYGANNASPVPSISGPTGNLLEGSVLNFDARASTDADDDDDILTFSWNFGDGTCAGGSPPAACSDDNPDHTYANDGNYGYSVTVSDGFDAGATGSAVDILNVIPVVSAGADITLDEGDQLSRDGSFTDPGADHPWTATVDYGDGGGPQALTLNGKSFVLLHTYVDNVPSPVDVTVAVTDDDDTGTDVAVITVNNVNPSVSAGPDIVVESGETYDFSGTFTDPGIVDHPWGWVLDWGFGSNSSGQTNDQSAAIEVSRQVCVAGDYTVSLTVTDKDGGVGTDELSLMVPYIGIDIDIMPGSLLNPLNMKSGGNIPVAILGSADLDVAEINASSLTIGDGTGPDTPIAGKNNGAVEAYMEDVNKDGMMDLVAMFEVRDLVGNGDVTDASTELVVRGFLTDACTNIRGSDSVTVRD
jgi:astacin